MEDRQLHRAELEAAIVQVENQIAINTVTRFAIEADTRGMDLAIEMLRGTLADLRAALAVLDESASEGVH